MKNIDEVVLQNDRWRKLAEGICGSYDLAQDLVQEMYIKIIDKKDISDGYIFITLRNIWLTGIKKDKTVPFASELNSIPDVINNFEVEDHQFGYVKRFYELPMRQQELILESYDFSIRQIADKFSINRMYVHRQIHKGLKYVLQDDYEMYSSSYTKHLLIKNN